jgi:hypothetical protein
MTSTNKQPKPTRRLELNYLVITEHAVISMHSRQHLQLSNLRRIRVLMLEVTHQASKSSSRCRWIARKKCYRNSSGSGMRGLKRFSVRGDRLFFGFARQAADDALRNVEILGN